jgi:hypothetical protein
MPRRVPRETTRHGLELVDIASPYTGTDRVLRRVDSLARLHRTGVINDREMRAAEHYRTAFETVQSAGIHCAFSSEPSGSPSSRTPPQQALEAAEALAEARKLLGKTDDAVVWRIVVWGDSIVIAAGILFAGDRHSTGHRLRWALFQLADLWFGDDETPRRNHAHREPDAQPRAGMTKAVTPSKVAHASRRGVAY